MLKLIKIVKKISALLLLVSLSIIGCTKSDDYLKYLEEGEIVYTGKIDSLMIYSGRDRVFVKGLFIADPKIVMLRAFWNNGADSLEVPISRTEGVDTLKLNIPVPEGIHNFYFITYDSDGNKSLPVYKTGISYGARYQSGLINRSLNQVGYFAGDNKTTIHWGGIDLTSGARFIDVEYSNSDGKIIQRRESIDSTVTVLDDLFPSEILRYRTVYMPDTLSIDTFYSEFSQPIMADVIYFKNISFPFQGTYSEGGRYGSPSNWKVNDSGKNYTADNVNYFGGLENNNGTRHLSLEAGWSQWKTPTGAQQEDMVNGKLMQTATLAAGTYSIHIPGYLKGTTGEVYLCVAEGEEVPDIEDMEESIVYKIIPKSDPELGSISISFTIDETKVISFGFVANLIGGWSSGSFFNVKSTISFLKES